MKPAKKPLSPADETNELVRRLIVVTMFANGASYDAIAHVTGKQKAWVVALLRKHPRRAK